MLAPFWTDLDGTGAPGIFAATLTDGVDDWIVVEWQVNVFGTTSNRALPDLDRRQRRRRTSRIAYDPAALPADPAGQDFLVGAENEIGQGDDGRDPADRGPPCVTAPTRRRVAR